MCMSGTLADIMWSLLVNQSDVASTWPYGVAAIDRPRITGRTSEAPCSIARNTAMREWIGSIARQSAGGMKQVGKVAVVTDCAGETRLRRGVQRDAALSAHDLRELRSRDRMVLQVLPADLALARDQHELVLELR